MASHLIRKDYESGKTFLIDNTTGETCQITQTGEHIKKFSLDLTGKLGYKSRMLQQDPSHHPNGTESLQKFPQFYIPQMDKFDGYAQLPRTIQKPFYNNNNIRPRSIGVIEQTLDFIKQQSFNEKYKIEKPIKHITGSLQDFELVQKLKKLKVLEHRKTTKQRNFTNHVNSVKIINNNEIKIPNVTNISLMRRSRIKSQLLPKTFPMNMSREGSVTRQLIPLEEKERQSLQSYQQYQSEHKESEILYESRTFNKSSSQSRPSRDELHSSHLSVNHFKEQIEIAQKEEQAYVLPIKKEKTSILSKGRFSVKTKNNGDQYVTDRMIMQLFQPELFK